jgi:hypothetical protein
MSKQRIGTSVVLRFPYTHQQRHRRAYFALPNRGTSEHSS